MTKNTKGVLFALGAALAMSNVYIFSKAALNVVHLAQFGFYWFGLGIVWNLIYFFSFKKQKGIKQISPRSWWSLSLISALEMVGTFLFFLSLDTIENPAIVSFLSNANPLFVVAMGILFLKERFNTIEFAGLAITLSGAVLISVTGVSQAGSLFVPGAQYIFMSGFIFSLSTLVAKKQLKYFDASYLATARLLLLFIAAGISVLWLGLPVKIESEALLNIGIGSLMGPFLSGILGYLALKNIEMSKATMVRSVRSLFVLVGAFLYFGTFPNFWQIIGGLFTIIGVLLISFGKLRRKKDVSNT